MIILEILKYTLPSVVVFLTAYFLFKQQNQKEILLKDKDLMQKDKEDLQKRRMQNNETILPIKLQAYERLTLFLERIHPNQLILRYNSGDLNSFQFQSILIKSLRDEFEHNLSQQLYVSDKAWTQVQKAKEECIKQINFAASTLDSHAKANELGSIIIQNYSQLNPPPIQQAIRQLKNDLAEGL